MRKRRVGTRKAFLDSDLEWYKKHRTVLRTSKMSNTAKIVKTVASDFYGGRLNLSKRGISFSPWSQMPEVKFLLKMRDSGVSGRTARLFLTFISAMDRARDANRLWMKGAELFRSRPELFDPAEVTKISPDKLKSLLVAGGVSQRHGQDSKAWHDISASLDLENSPIRRVIDHGLGDAEELLKALRSKDNTGRPKFPLLCGPKSDPCGFGLWLGRAEPK